MRALSVLVSSVALVGAACAGGDPICINGGTDCYQAGTEPPERSFANEVVGTFGNQGCLEAACHTTGNEANAGQLALDGDCNTVYDELKNEDREDTSMYDPGPRVMDGENGAQSFLVQKSTNANGDHTGAGALSPDSQAYTIIVQWINGDQANDCDGGG